MALINEKQTIRYCFSCGDIFKASANEFVLSKDGTCKGCEGTTGFFTNNDHLRGFILRYNPDLLKVRDIELRKALNELTKGVEHNA